MDRHEVSGLKERAPSLDAFECLANVFAKYKYIEKKIGESPPGMRHYAVRLPENCLVQKSLTKEKQCLFTFADGSELILPHIAIKGRMIQADAGFNSDQVESFTLAGSANDFENRALIAFLKNEPKPFPNEKVSGEILVELLYWTKENGYEGLFKQLSNKLKVTSNPFC